MAAANTEATVTISSTVPGGTETEIFYRQSGNGPPLVWLHWLWGEPGWMPQHEKLSEQFTVYVPDLPGFGQSGPLPSWARRPRDLALMLLQAIDKWGLDKPTVVGSCLGGWLGAEMAALRPEKIDKLVLIAPLGLALDWIKFPNIFYANPDDLFSFFMVDNGGEERANSYMPHRKDWSQAFLTNRITSTTITFDPYLHSRTLPHRLCLADVQSLVIWGENDPLVSKDHAALWDSHLPNSSSLIIPRSGHLPYVEECDAVVTAITKFTE